MVVLNYVTNYLKIVLREKPEDANIISHNSRKMILSREAGFPVK